MTTTDRVPGTTTPAATERVAHGVAGGLLGGLVFGVMMQAGGMLPVVAGLVGSESVAVGWLVHLAISAVIGALFGLLLAGRVRGAVGTGALLGVAYGALWWVLGPLLVMPLAMGMPPFTVDAMALQSLLGHLVFGALLGLTVALLQRRRA